MEKIIRFRDSQPITLDDFIEQILDKPSCKYCIYLKDCTESMGTDIIDIVGEDGCTSFDNTITGLKDIYLKEYVTTGT